MKNKFNDDRKPQVICCDIEKGFSEEYDRTDTWQLKCFQRKPAFESAVKI